MEIDEILLLIEKAGAVRLLQKAAQEIHLFHRFFLLLRKDFLLLVVHRFDFPLRRKGVNDPLHIFLGVEPFRVVIAVDGYTVLPGERIHQYPAVRQKVAVRRHGLQVQPEIGDELLRHEPQRGMGAAEDMGKELRIFEIHHAVAQGPLILHMEIGSSFPDDRGIEGIIVERCKHHPGAKPALEILRSRHNHPGLHIVVPILLRQSRQRLPGEDMAAELVNVPAEGRLIHRAERRDGIKVVIHIHESGGSLQLHIIQHEKLVIPDRRRKGDKGIAENSLQIMESVRLIGKGIVPAANAAHKPRKPVLLRILKPLGQRRQSIHKKTIVLHPRLRRRQLHPGTHPPQHLAVRLPNRKKTIGIPII